MDALLVDLLRLSRNMVINASLGIACLDFVYALDSTNGHL